MALEGTYEPSPWDWVRDQIEKYEASNGAEGTELEGKPCVILWTRGRHSGTVRKSALMRVADDAGNYAVVASMGGAPKHPVWYLNLQADPDVTLQDGAELKDYRGARGRGRREGRVVEARDRRLARVRRVPDQDRPRDPAGGARTPLSPALRRLRSVAVTAGTAGRSDAAHLASSGSMCHQRSSRRATSVLGATTRNASSRIGSQLVVRDRPTQPHPDPAAVADVGRAEEHVGLLVDHLLLHARRRRAPDAEDAVAVVIVDEHRDRLLVPHEPRRRAVTRPLGDLGKRRAHLPHPGELAVVGSRPCPDATGARCRPVGPAAVGCAPGRPPAEEGP